VIGCVSGPHCDGQVLVLHDILGFTAGHRPRAVKRYAELHKTLLDAFSRYAQDVRGRTFPSEADGISMPEPELEKLRRELHPAD